MLCRRAVVLSLVILSAAAETPVVAVAPQYDSTHVYVAPEKFAAFVASLLAVFGGTASKQGVVTVTPTPSTTLSQLVLTPVGTFSVFGFQTPVPYPFGLERTGYLVTDIDAAVSAARAAGAAILVRPFSDAIGRDAIVQFPGGVNTQLYWHTKPPSYPALKTIPENRVYLAPESVPAFLRSFLAFSHGRVTSDEPRAPGVEIGRSAETYRRIRLVSPFGKLTALVTTGQLPYPFGWEKTGYEVANLAETLAKAGAAQAAILVPPYTASGRTAAIVEFPGGWVAEIHTCLKEKPTCS